MTNDIPSNNKLAHSENWIALRYGALGAGFLLGYFLLMWSLGLAETTELRYFNFFFLLGAVWLGLRRFFREHGFDQGHYFTGLKTGMSISLVAATFMALSVYIFIKFIDPGMGMRIAEAASIGFKPPIEVLMLIVMMEGFFSGFLVSFISMQYFK